METQTFWQKNHVLIIGIITAILTVIAPYALQDSSTWDWQNIITGAIIAGASFYGNDARGKGWTIGGQISSALIAVTQNVDPHHVDIPRLVLIAAISFGSVGLIKKSAEYEQSPTIQQAKSEAAEIKAVNDNTPPKQL